MSYRTRDQRIADETLEDRELMCQAHGCPCRWTVDMGNGRLCHWHDRAESRDWPRITEELHAASLEHSRRKQADANLPPPDVPRLRRELAKLAASIKANADDPKAWARRLRVREDAGEKLSRVQRDAWREALAGHAEELE